MTTKTPTLIFASAGSDDDALVLALTSGIAAEGVSVLVVEPDAEKIASAVSACEGVVVLGGFSRGARAAVEATVATPAGGLLCVGFPFHPRGAPEDEPERISALASVDVDTLVIQGSRDAHGDKHRGRGFDLPENIRVEWIKDGNHRLAPRRRAGVSLEENLARAVQVAVEFLRSLKVR